MIVHEGYEDLNFTAPVVTLGVFDGVHRGHMALLKALVLKAKDINGESVVITFAPHPRIILEKNKTNLAFLTTMEEKQKLLEDAGIDHMIIIKFDNKFSEISACDFIKEILVNKIGTNHLIIGFNHRFGRSGEGDYNTIKNCVESYNFSIDQFQGVQTDSYPISSSMIRKALLEGRLDEANMLLGYSYTLTGKVIGGRKLGKRIGFPTANIQPDYEFKLVPANGIYAVTVLFDGIRYLGMMSIGTNPTVNSDSNSRSIEVNIFNFDQDIYGREISVTFMKRLRDEVKFDNTDQLAEQMNRDKQEVLSLLG